MADLPKFLVQVDVEVLLRIAPQCIQVNHDTSVDAKGCITYTLLEPVELFVDEDGLCTARRAA